MKQIIKSSSGASFAHLTKAFDRCPNCGAEMRRLEPNIEYHLLGGDPYKSVIVYDDSTMWCSDDGTLINLKSL